jgi:hypothetical protein
MERFSSSATLAQLLQGFHMERAMLHKPSRPGVAHLSVPSLTLTNSEQESRFYLITMTI